MYTLSFDLSKNVEYWSYQRASSPPCVTYLYTVADMFCVTDTCVQNGNMLAPSPTVLQSGCAEWESKKDFFEYIMGGKDTEVKKLAEWIEVSMFVLSVISGAMIRSARPMSHPLAMCSTAVTR
jgi:hypothetical protein